MDNIDETKINFTVDQLKDIPELNFKSYIELTEHLGKQIQDLYGIYYLVPLVQSAHESRNGNSLLARNHCNLFGIVATDSWKKKGGLVALMPTWEHIKGKDIQTNREFREYKSWKDSFHNWGEIISTLNCYKEAYKLLQKKEDVVLGIQEMAKSYATDPKYAKKLVDLYSVGSEFYV